MHLKGRIKNLSILILRIAFSLGLIIFLFYKFDFAKTLLVIKKADLNYFIFVLLLTFFVNFLLLLRWYMLIKACGIKIPFKRIVVAFCGGIFFNLFLPSAAGGDIVRSIALFGQTKERAKVVASVILDRLSGFISIAIIASISLFIGFKLVNDSSILLILAIVLLSLFSLTLILFNSTIFSKFSKAFIRFKGIKLKLENLHNSIKVYRHKYKVIFANILLSFISQLISIFSFFLIAKSLHTHIDFIYFFIFVPLIFAISIIPISIGGLGVRDGSFIFLFSKVGVSPNISLSISLINFFTLLISGIVGGIIYVCSLYLRRLQYRKTN
ncbi:MAG: lysylphosphatidylglycerol synthase transmembrane domain-containing protein [Candidatus Omnitrophota bacterium]|nr:lysylphosphatidylglycerol synthase transmembrane domain-containing protein [Candidatus Omnitrophota bacterium]